MLSSFGERWYKEDAFAWFPWAEAAGEIQAVWAAFHVQAWADTLINKRPEGTRGEIQCLQGTGQRSSLGFLEVAQDLKWKDENS